MLPGAQLFAAALGTALLPFAVGAQTDARPIRVSGVAYDSLVSAPLSGAFVMIAATTRNARADSAGRFYFDSIPPGTHTFILQHPALDSIGLGERTLTASPTSERDTIRISVPSLRTLWTLVCGAGAAPPDSGIIFGSARFARTSAPATRALVSVSWTELSVDKKTGIQRHTTGGAVRAGADGSFAVCGLPTDATVQLTATADSATTGTLDFIPNPARVRRRDLLLGRAGARGDRGVIAGTVRGADGRPIAGARVSTDSVPETRSDTGGRFVLRDAPAGTRQVGALAIGAKAASALVDVIPGDTAVVEFELLSAIVLDPVTVNATTFRSRFMRETEARRKQYTPTVMDSVAVQGHADFRSAVTALPWYTCLSTLWIDGVKFTRRDLGDEIRHLNPETVAFMEWYHRNPPPQYGPGGCVLVVWSKVRVPH